MNRMKLASWPMLLLMVTWFAGLNVLVTDPLQIQAPTRADASWLQVNNNGFGDSNNAGTNWRNATAGFLNQLYVGTANAVDGGELWRKPLTLNEKVYLPVILRMP